ncbi:LysR family transcriptional regulator [Azospirillum halopraeferens]|uniref:LysR family transcriptional regulator n=1 Tax=Azospirillum halopraeferens TaxID=34010 RepID=UPI0006848F76|nr:LysR family transcriptional regulator [Azospirillum halopraeferens]
MAKLRKLRVALAVAERGQIAAAARRLGVSQSAATRAVQALEEELGAELFHRSPRRLACTEAGHALTRRVARALAHLRAAEEVVLATAGPGRLASGPLSQQAADHELQALIAVGAGDTISAAARANGLSQPALNRSLRTLEIRLGLPLFLRTRDGLRPTPEGEELLRRTKLALTEIRQGVEELALLRGAAAGRARIGALPMSRTRLVPLAVERLLERFPAAEVAIVDGTYGSLLGSLRNGDLDVIVGTIRTPPPTEDIVSEELFRDDIVIVARAGHPVAAPGRPAPVLADCLDCGWVLPFKGVPLRTQFEAALAGAGLPAPQRLIETDSLAVVRALLMRSDRLAIVSRHQVDPEVALGVLTILPIPFPDVLRPVGLTLRRDYAPTPVTLTLLDALRAVAAEIGGPVPVAA